jgi:hypothetical protein
MKNAFALIAVTAALLSITLWISAPIMFGSPISGGTEDAANRASQQLQSQASESERLAAAAQRRFTGHNQTGAPTADSQWAEWHDAAGVQAHDYQELSRMQRHEAAEKQQLAETARLQRLERFSLLHRSSLVALALALLASIGWLFSRLSNARYATP